MKRGRVSGDVFPHWRAKSTFAPKREPGEFREMAREESKGCTEATWVGEVRVKIHNSVYFALIRFKKGIC